MYNQCADVHTSKQSIKNGYIKALGGLRHMVMFKLTDDDQELPILIILCIRIIAENIILQVRRV